MTRPRRSRSMLWLLALVVWLPAGTAQAGHLTDGVMDLVSAPFELPMQTLAGTISGPPLVGTVAGVLTGAVSTVGKVLRGVGELVAGAFGVGAAAAPLAPYALPFIL